MQTRGLLNEELQLIRHELAIMAAKVEEDLGKALVVLRSGDISLAEEALASEEIINNLQLKIDDMALTLVATQQPVASDLRELVTVFKISSSLERIGDYCVHLIKAAVKLSSRAAFRSMERIERMVITGQQMLKDAFSAYLARDAEAARKSAVLDTQIDIEHKALTEEVLALMKKQPQLVKPAARLLRLSGNMERLGDHITNICEGIIFMTEGNREELNN